MSGHQKPLAIITGGTSGIGLATAELLKESHQLALIYLQNSQRAQEAEKKLNPFTSCKTWAFDVSSDSSVSEGMKPLLDFYGQGAEVLINSAGVVAPAEFFIQQKNLKRHIDIMNINYFGCLRMIQQVLPSMYKQSRGFIINISSISSLGGVAGLSSYAASKAALEFFTKSLAVEVGHRGISVNCIRPGMTETPMTKELLEEARSNKAKINLPLGRAILPEEIARTILYLIQSGPVLNGEIITVDGGSSVRRVPSISF